MKTFEKYLEEQFMLDYHGDKDHFEKAFDNWLSNLEREDYMNSAELYGQGRYLEGKEDLLENIKEVEIRKEIEKVKCDFGGFKSEEEFVADKNAIAQELN